MAQQVAAWHGKSHPTRSMTPATATSQNCTGNSFCLSLSLSLKKIEEGSNNSFSKQLKGNSCFQLISFRILPLQMSPSPHAHHYDHSNMPIPPHLKSILNVAQSVHVCVCKFHETLPSLQPHPAQRSASSANTRFERLGLQLQFFKRHAEYLFFF